MQQDAAIGRGRTRAHDAAIVVRFSDNGVRIYLPDNHPRQGDPMKSTWLSAAAIAAAFFGGLAVRDLLQPPRLVYAAAADRVFELRTYTAPPGKLEALKARFRDHTIGL